MLLAALGLIEDRGPRAVTHRSVARAAGVPLAATTYYFSSIDDLLASALELATEEEIARFRVEADELLSAVEVGPAPAERLAELMLAALAGERKALIAQYELWLEATRRPALRESARRSTEAYVELATELLRRVGSAAPETDGRLLIAAVDGLLLEALTEPGEIDPARLRPALTRLLAALSAPVPERLPAS